ncbi:hypothetical protein [Paenibacillus qinlingensis]|uniref:hypothetical protein n=1 Tax=Paenibacillus qinlingensis TaxID=1837343 RepID=UPI0015640840|nr:hypothetical protein [Paenibacillus qinlingensis]NQX59968.1 hypothetical protein [Paenibacillus qinlingensis]
MKQKYYELILYKLLSNSDFEAYKASVDMLNAFLEEIPGFVKSNVFYQAEMKLWIELTVWDSKEAAKRSDEALMLHVASKQRFTCIEIEKMPLTSPWPLDSLSPCII